MATSSINREHKQSNCRIRNFLLTDIFVEIVSSLKVAKLKSLSRIFEGFLIESVV